MSNRLSVRFRQLRNLIIPAISILVAAVVESVLRTYYAQMQSYYYEYKVRRTAKRVGSGLYIRGKSRVNSDTVLGDNVYLHGMDIPYEGSVTIGDNFHAGEGCKIITENHNYDDGNALPYGDTFVRKDVDIGDNVWLGVDVLVLPGVSIGEGAVIQAGSTVVSDIPKGAIAGGHPAEVFEQRDMDHYETLKAEGRFN